MQVEGCAGSVNPNKVFLGGIDILVTKEFDRLFISEEFSDSHLAAQ